MTIPKKKKWGKKDWELFLECLVFIRVSLILLNVLKFALMSRIERKYCLISASYLTGLCDIFISLHIWQNCVCFGDFLPMRTRCDAYHKEFESH